jgi:uncharacterized delta-60 repeat protein
MTGAFSDSVTFGQGEPSETTLTADDEIDIFIARYNPDGTFVWAKRAGGDWEDSGSGIAVLSDDSTVVTGYFGSIATFGAGEPNETVLNSDDEYDTDIFIARYNPDGSLAWAKRVDGEENDDSGLGITRLSDNSTVVTGTLNGSAIFGPGEYIVDIFIARYFPDGTLAWAKRAGGDGYDYGNGITTLSDNSAVVTGYFEESATFGPGEPNETVLTSAGYYDCFIARYNPDGSLAWVKHAGGSNYDAGNVITTLSDDSTVVTGSFSGAATFGPGEPNQKVLYSFGNSEYDIFVARFEP